jgi:hypothetical protein
MYFSRKKTYVFWVASVEFHPIFPLKCPVNDGLIEEEVKFPGHLQGPVAP